MTTAPSSPPDPPERAAPALGRLAAGMAGLALMVPIEVGTRLVEAVPAVADKVPGLIERARREVVLARFIGKLAVDQGMREVRARLNPEATPAAPSDMSDPTIDESPSPIAEAGHIGEPTPTARADAQSLALADYDHLSSAQIVAMLSGLDVNERTAIETYELAGRHRRTVLGKLEQLRSST